MNEPLVRALLGVIAAAIVALVAWRLGALTRGGLAAAVVVGGAAVSAGYEWGGVLLVFFIGSMILGRWRAKRRDALTGAIVEKSGARDARQVLANGGIFAAAAAAFAATGEHAMLAVGLGAIVAANADTWSTEIGTVAGGTPRSIRGWKRVAPGTSGAISLQGSVAAFAGAAFLGAVAIVFGFPRDLGIAAALGGVAGAAADSVAGATFQERRWCDECGCATERRTHRCGRATRHAGGMRWVRNDMVNFVCTATGAAVALAFRP